MTPEHLIRELRARRGITQAELAGRLGRSQAAVAKVERPGANPTVATLSDVMRAMGYRLRLDAVEEASSVDESLVASYLRMSPAERLQSFMSSHDSLAHLKALANRSDASVQG